MQPSEKIYTDLVNIVMNVEFFQGGGWNRSKIGWFWGGMTVQGVLPYYYNKITTPGRSQIIDRCYYNTMADTEPCRFVNTLFVVSPLFFFTLLHACFRCSYMLLSCCIVYSVPHNTTIL